MEYLSRKGIPFVEKNVRSDPSALQELIGLGFNATPVIRIDGKSLVGFNPQEIDAALGTTAGAR